MASSQLSSGENTDKVVQSSYMPNFSFVIYLNSLPFITIFSVTGLKFPVVFFSTPMKSSMSLVLFLFCTITTFVLHSDDLFL